MLEFFLNHGIYGEGWGILFILLEVICIIVFIWAFFHAIGSFGYEFDVFGARIIISIVVMVAAVLLFPLRNLVYWGDSSGIIYAADYSVYAAYDGPCSIKSAVTDGEYIFSWLENGEIQKVAATGYYKEEDGSLTILTEKSGTPEGQTELVESVSPTEMLIGW